MPPASPDMLMLGWLSFEKDGTGVREACMTVYRRQLLSDLIARPPSQLQNSVETCRPEVLVSITFSTHGLAKGHTQCKHLLEREANI